ncbi:4370_t:CDS:2 [Funneliformis geosporum]|nr:4370_t:CDS:2 [Funneliformis geosporum]
MAAVQSRLPAPSHKIVGKNTIKPTENLPSSAPALKTKSSPITVPTKKPNFAHVKPRIGSLDNVTHKPKGGDKKIYSERSNFSNVKSRIGSLENVNHTPKGGDLKIVSVKSDFSKVKSRVGSLDNINHLPKVQSLINVNNVPQGGNVKLISNKPNFKQVHSRVGSFDNIDHTPKGGDKIIFNDKLNFTNVKSRVGSLDNIQHLPKGGDVKIFDEKLKFRELANPKIISRSSTNSSGDSSIIADDDRSSLVNSPISSLALDDVPEEVDDPPSHEEYQTLYLTPHTPHTPVIEVMSPIMERFEEEGIHEDLSHITEIRFREPFQESNKYTEFSSETNFVDNGQYFSGKETHYQHGIVYEEDFDEEAHSNFQRDTTSIRGSTIFVSENPLNDTDLSFEVNVQRKSFLLSEANRISIIENINPAPSKELIHAVEIPPKDENDCHNLELTLAQQRIYDESWL